MQGFQRRTWLGILALVVCVARAVTSQDSDTMSPRFISQPNHYTINQGDDVTIECTIEGLGTDGIVIWSGNQSGEPSTIALNGKVSSDKRDRYSVIGDKSRGHQHLVIKQALVADEGTFSCELFGSAIRQEHRLTVNIPASVTVSTPGFLAVKLGDPIVISCAAQGKPTPIVTWSKTGGVLPNGQSTMTSDTLMITASTIDDAGEYFCAADNGALHGPATAFVEVLVEYAPSVIVEEGLIDVKVAPSTTISLVCVFDSQPPVEVIWRHNLARIQFDKRGRLTETGEDGRFVMEMMGVYEEDLGQYECVGGNRHGQAIGAITVRAEPHGLEISSVEDGAYSDQYNLEWGVNSHNQLIQFDLKVQEVNNTNSTGWMSNTVPAPRDHPIHHTQQYLIKELKPATLYNGQLRAQNKYGLTEWVEFQFNTNQEGNPAPLVTPTKPDKDSYTIIIEPQEEAIGSNGKQGLACSWLLVQMVTMVTALIIVR